MKKLHRSAIPGIVALLALALAAVGAPTAALAHPQASTGAFHFVFSADSRGDYTVLPDFSHRMTSLSPAFGFFGGDLCSTFDTSCINNQWKPAMDGNDNDGMLDRTFVGRGNHDSGTLSTWQGLWDFQAMAGRTGATHYTAQSGDATYSFDYGNSHFAVIDNPSSGASGLTSTQISWLDSDLTAAEGRGAVHEFLISHGPMYPVTSEHSGDVPSASLKSVLNKHPSLIGFHGHEHVTAYTLVTPGFESGITRYPQFTLGRAGAPAYSVDKPVTWSAGQDAFGDVAVDGASVTVTVYSQGGSALYSASFSHSGTVAPTPTPGSGGGATVSETFVSTAGSDGYVLESSETSNQGGAVNAAGNTFRLGDDGSNRQYRAVLSFDTSGLPDNAVVSAVTLKFKQAGSGGSNPYSSMGNIMGDILGGAFGGSPTLQAGDFQAASDKNSALSVPNTPSSGWYSKNMSSSYFSYVSKTGVTQIRLRFATDDNNNRTADYLSFYTGETGTAANRPVLVIKYSVP